VGHIQLGQIARVEVQGQPFPSRQPLRKDRVPVAQVLEDDAVAAQRAADRGQECDPKTLQRCRRQGRSRVQRPGASRRAAFEAAVRVLMIAADDLPSEPGLKLGKG